MTGGGGLQEVTRNGKGERYQHLPVDWSFPGSCGVLWGLRLMRNMRQCVASIATLFLLVLLIGGCTTTRNERLLIDSWGDVNAVGIHVDDVSGRQYYWLYRDQIPGLIAEIERNTEPSDYSRSMQTGGCGIFVFGTSDFKQAEFAIVVRLQATPEVGGKNDPLPSGDVFAPQAVRYQKIKELVQSQGTVIDEAEFVRFAYEEQPERVVEFYWLKD